MLRKAFTMAEVLITLVVIGVIASVTIPSVIRHQHDKETAARLKKAYSTLQQTATTSRAFYGDFSTWDLTDGSIDSLRHAYETYFKPYMKVGEECFDETGCWSESRTLAFDGDGDASSATDTGVGGDTISITMPDGMNVCIDVFGSAVDTTFGVVNGVFYPTLAFIVDINGNKGPNRMGKDVFAFVAVQGGIVPAGTDTGSSKCYDGASGGYSGFDCAAKVLRTDSSKY